MPCLTREERKRNPVKVLKGENKIIRSKHNRRDEIYEALITSYVLLVGNLIAF
jgi:hypothetical protein